MVRETRHLWVGNLPDNIREDRIREHFKRYGRVQNVKLLGRMENASANTNAVANSGVCATVAFMDIKSASKAHNVEHVLDERTLTTEYYEPAAIPSSAGAPSAGSSPAGSGYSGSSSSVNSAPVPVTTSRYHLSGEESAGNACAMAASAAAPATWRGTNDSATEYCRRGNTPAAYGRTTPHHRWCATVVAGGVVCTAGGGGVIGGESTPSTSGGGTERRRRHSESGSSRSETSSPEPSDTSRASTPPADHRTDNHTLRRTPPPHTHQWPSTVNGRPLAICVRNLPTRSTDSSLKDGLYHEYKKHGKVVWVKVVGQNADRYAVVRFKKPSDVEKALEVSQDKLFFGCKISVAPHQSCDDDAESAKPYETDIDEYHPKATRTLFIGNLEKDVTQQQLRDKFKHFGRIIEIDIKKGSGGGAGYAFCQYGSISSVVEAIRAMDGEYVGNSRVKLGFGKPVATTCVWVDGLTEHTEKQVLGAVSRCGAATSVCVDRAAGAALVHFEQAAAAGGAVRELRRVAAQLSAAEPDHPRLCVDYASRECQEAFYEQLEKHGGSAALAGAERVAGDLSGRYIAARHETLRYEAGGTNRSRAPSFSRASSRTPRYNTNDHYDPADYAADRRYRVFDDLGSSPQTDDANYEERLQSVVVSPHRGHKHRRDSSPEGRKHSKERHRSAGGGSRRSRSGSRGHSSRRRHRRRRDGSESRGSRASRAGTPLRDELDAPPTEPRRPPRERPPLPMSLPLPKFAVQLLRAAPPQPRLLPPAPASPPRPPSASSSSGGSAPHSPSLEERIRSLDEKYERWTGSRAHIDAPDRSRLRHRLLELDVNEVKPSDVVRSLLAKRSVFDEDSERLEGATRAPSPGGSPRSLPVSTSRVLRYPFPVHGVHTSTSSAINTLMNPMGPVQPPEPDEYDRMRLLNIDKITKHVDIENGQELRMRMRTPSTDRPLLDISDKKHSPTNEKTESRSLPETETKENKRRNSFISNMDENKTTTIPDKATLERINLEKSIEKSILEIQEKYNIRDSKIICEDKVTTSIVASIKKEDVIEEKIMPKASDFFNKFERKCFREDNKSRCLEIKNNLKQEINMDLNKSDKYLFASDYHSKSEIMLMDMKQKIDHDKKSEFNCQPKESERFREKYHNPSNKNITSLRVQSESHFNSLNYIDLPKNKLEIGEESSNIEKNHKDPLVKNLISSKDNLVNKQNDETQHTKCDKLSDNVQASNHLMSFEEKSSSKLQEDCAKIEKEKSRHIRDKTEKDMDRDKSKTKQSSSKFDKHDKERKIKDDSVGIKIHSDKSDRNRNDKELEKILDKDRDIERSKANEERISRHDNHKRDKQERERKKDTPENENLSKGPKKEERHKNDRPKKDSDNKRDNKREGDSSKSRKSSRDESIRDICRKDSTDSTTSRASHDSSKSRESENIEPREETKSKIKGVSDVINKIEATEKESTSKHQDHNRLESKIKVKTETKDEKDLIEQHFRNKIDNYVDNKKNKMEGSEKSRHYSLDSPSVDAKRKERLNSCSSLPSNIGHKRRMSSQDSIDCLNEEIKKGKNERRDYKDLKIAERHKTTKFSKGHFAKIIESKTKDDKKNQVKPPDDIFSNTKSVETKEITNEKLKTSRKSPIESIEAKTTSVSNASSDPLQNNFDFLATLELRSSEEDEKQKALRKEMKEKKRIQQLQQIQELQMQQDALQQAEIGIKIKDDRKLKIDEKKKDISREKRMSTERKSKDEKTESIKRRNRKQLHSTDTSDSDEPKKHSIFDIVDDEYNISMYDKVKARSCKNMQKQEEEKRQEKIKAKFSQLKQSRAKREEKKRSSWDEDSDSDSERRKPHKVSMDSSSDEDDVAMHNKIREKSQGSSLEYDRNRTNDYFDAISNEEDSRNKLSRKNSRTRIMSDSSDDENNQRKNSKSPSFIDRIKKEVFSDSESSTKCKDIDTESQLKQSSEDKVKKTSLLNLFGKSDSEDNRLKSTFENDNDYRMSFTKSFPNDLSSENESIPNRISSELRRKHKKKQKKYKFTFSDEENKSSHDVSVEIRNKHKNSDKNRRHSNKKEKRRDKIRESVDTDELREEKDKIKIEKMSPNQSFDSVIEAMSNNNKKEGKMEDIFGPLSDESDREVKSSNNKIEALPSECETHTCSGADKLSIDEMKIRDKDEMKRRKEKRRKEKRHFVKEDENSLDVDAVSKAIEARLFEDSNADENTIKLEKIDSKDSENELKYIGVNYKGETNKYNEKSKKESRDRKKKKKRNREDRQSRKEHHHEKLQKVDTFLDNHMEQLSPKTLLDIPLPTDIPKVEMTDKSDDSKSLSESPSLPRITDSPSFVLNSDDINNTANEYDTPKSLVVDEEVEIDYEMTRNIEVTDIPMPPPLDNIVQDISEVPLPKDPPIDQTLEISLPDSEDSSVNTDVKQSEVAVKSISNLETETEKTGAQTEKNVTDCKGDKKVEEKPRAIISQEETEDAVAALLGESFGGKVNTFDCYEEVECNTTNEMEIENTTNENEIIPEEDAEEMRQAVQNLNASEMEMKPDTPVSDDNLLLIDTDTEETEETTQDAIESLPVNIIATSQSLNNNTKTTIAQSPEVTNIHNVISKPKPTMAHSVQQERNDSINKVSEEEVKPTVIKQESVEQITSTATPVITSWTLSKNKLIEPQVVNVPVSSINNRESSENSKTHIKTNIVQIKTSHNPKIQINNSLRPIINSNRVNTAPYQVINQMIRPQVSNIQPPTIKIPESHIIYQKPTNIVISPRINNEPIILSPKSNLQTEGMTSPRLPNMALINTSPQNVVGSPNTTQQRSPGQVTVVRMQQPPLSPIHAMHIPHARAMVSPNRPNSVLVQTQGAPIHFNRLPVTPILAPISKQINANIIQPNKGSGSYDSVLMHQQKISQAISGDRGKPENATDTSKIILSPNRLPTSSPTVMAQNRLIPVQNSIHVSNINAGLSLSNKVLINNKSPFSDKRDIHITKSEHNFTPTSSPIIHLSGSSHSSSTIIQASPKSIISSLQEVTTVSRGHGSNVIHSINTQRHITSCPITSVIHLEASKGPPSVLSMATVRTSSPGVKSELSNTVVVTTSSLANVVMTPLLLKTSPNPKPTIRLHTRSESEQIDNICNTEIQVSEDRTDTTHKELEQKNNMQKSSSPIDHVPKCETDFEELLKDNINEIKIINDPHKKIEINVGKNVAIMSPIQNRRNSTDVALIKHEVETLIKNEADDVKIIKKVESVDVTSVKICGNDPTPNRNPENNMPCTAEKIPKTNDIDLLKPVTVDSNTVVTKDNTPPVNASSVDKESVRPEPGVNKNDFYNPLCNPSQAPINDIKNIDESDYWSGKDIINIESVIKKVDSLCNDSVDEKKIEDTKTQQPLAIEKKKSVERNIQNEVFIGDIETPKGDESNDNKIMENTMEPFQENNLIEECVSEKITTSKRGGRSGRGKKTDKNPDKVHTRQIAKSPRGSSKRGRGRIKVDKKIKNMINTNLNNIPGDVYDFHEDSGDETVTSPNKTEVRPRLILTIKSPLSGNSNAVVSSLSITQKDPVKVSEKHKEEKADVFASPSTNTRKSRRLQEKDIQRSSVDDIIDDVIKGSANQFKTINKDSNKKKTTRGVGIKTSDKIPSSDTRKSPRGVKRTRDRSLSDASTESCDENVKTDEISKESKIPKLESTITAAKCNPEPVVKPIIITGQTANPCPPNNNPIPIMKPPKKMISEISAKLASAFEAAANATNRIQERCILPSEPEQLPPPAEGAVGEGDAGYGRCLVDNVPSNMMPVGATEATDARVQSPALPHRPPSSHHLPDRATPILVRGGDVEGGPIGAMGALGAMGAMGAMDAGASLYRGAYPGAASLPRGAHHPPLAKQVAVIGQNHHPGSRVTITSVPSGSPQGQMAIGEGVYPHFSHHHYQMYQQHFRATQQENRDTPTSFTRGTLDAEGSEAPTPPLELRRPPSARVPRPAHSPSPHDRHIMYAVRCGRSPPPAHGTSRPPSALPPPAAPGPPHASQVPREADSLQMLLRRYPVMWQGLLALKNDSAAVQMHFVGGNPGVAADALSRHSDGTAASLLRIAQRMRLEPAQLDQVHRKMKLENEHCMLLALPCGRDHMDVLQQSTNLTAGFITYLQRKQAAGIVNVAPTPGHHQSMYTVHIFPSCEFANENLTRIAPDLMHRVSNIAHLLIVIATAIG